MKMTGTQTLNEFDVPKSAAKKSVGKKSAKDDDDDEFKDLGFDDLDVDGGGFDDDDDDF